jgi:hypothetical protein
MLEDELHDRMAALLAADETIMTALTRARAMALPDHWIVAGSLYQTIWNALTERPQGTGIRDIDLIYFDASDLSYEAEDRVIQRGREVFDGLVIPVEIRNQARVHLWFEERFGWETRTGTPYPPLRSSLESLTRYAAIAHAVAARIGSDGALEIHAPFGLSDIFSLTLRPNPRGDRNLEGFLKKARRMQETWPELTIIETWGI